jgi:hypothetical protein
MKRGSDRGMSLRDTPQAEALLNLIHTNNCSNPVFMRLPGGLHVAFAAPCGVWRRLHSDGAFDVLPTLCHDWYSQDRKAAYEAK